MPDTCTVDPAKRRVAARGRKVISCLRVPMLPLHQRHGLVLWRVSAGLALLRGSPAAGLYRLHWGGDSCGGACCLIVLRSQSG